MNPVETVENVATTAVAGEAKGILELFIMNPAATERLMLFIVCLILIGVVCGLAWLYLKSIRAISLDNKEMNGHLGDKITNLTGVIISTSKDSVESMNQLRIEITRLSDAITARDDLIKERLGNFGQQLRERPCLKGDL